MRDWGRPDLMSKEELFDEVEHLTWEKRQLLRLTAVLSLALVAAIIAHAV